MTPTRVVIADPLTMFRSGVRDVLDREKDFTTVEASSLRELVEVVTRTCPDIALIDLDLPPRGGIAAVGRLAEFSSLHAIPWSFAPDGDTVLSAIRSGASGYLDKDLSPAGLVRSLRGVRTGEAPLPRALVTRLIEGLHGLQEREHVLSRAELLSNRELEVLELVAHGARNKEIAAALFISEFTVKRHVQNILEKLDLRSRRAASAFYRAAFDGPDILAATTGESEVTPHGHWSSEHEPRGDAEEAAAEPPLSRVN